MVKIEVTQSASLMGLSVGLKGLVPGRRQPEQELSKHAFLAAISALLVTYSVTERAVVLVLPDEEAEA